MVYVRIGAVAQIAIKKGEKMVFAFFFFVLLIVSIGFWFYTTCTIEEYRLVISFFFFLFTQLKTLTEHKWQLNC